MVEQSISHYNMITSRHTWDQYRHFRNVDPYFFFTHFRVTSPPRIQFSPVYGTSVKCTKESIILLIII